jgi:hypothetical protein
LPPHDLDLCLLLILLVLLLLAAIAALAALATLAAFALGRTLGSGGAIWKLKPELDCSVVLVVVCLDETFHSELGGTTDFIVSDCTPHQSYHSPVLVVLARIRARSH